MKEYMKSIAEVMAEKKTSETGLDNEEARARLEVYGINKLDQAKKESIWQRLMKQLADPMTLILIAAAIISLALTVYNNISSGEYEFPSDVVIILSVVIINAILGVVQESKAEAAIDALQKMSEPTSKVMRESRIIEVRTEEIVPGDIIILEAGDAVPADARITECISMMCEESALTGESVPVSKTADAMKKADELPLGDRKNMLYAGSTLVYGRGKAIVTGTGMNTEMGKIANAISSAKDTKTPLQIKLSQLSRILTYLVSGICIAIFLISLAKTGSLSFDNVLDTFMIAVSLAVAAIPEGLAAVVTIVLSLGVTNMSKKNAIIRKMTAVETLGCTRIICSDKTGTLTQNKMTVVEHYGDDEVLLADAMSLCSDAELDEKQKTAKGEPTEAALVNYAFKLGLNKNKREKIFERIGEIPFDSSRKMMTTVHKDGKMFVQFTKGAPDVILTRCTHYMENGKAVPMTQKKYTAIISANRQMADSALRVLAASTKRYDARPECFESGSLENGLVFIGLVGMIDPVRPEVKPAIDECRLAGIRPVMITGDHKDTAVAIAMRLGIIKERSEAITGAELDRIPDESFENEVEKYSVYARVQPEHKTKIVKAWQKKGKVTAMTGDGVNDAPSIKSADIGIGMGITGTDVTKNVADMILADDNFATIVSAVSEGRRIYDNIRKAIQFLLASNLAEVLSIFIATLLSFTIFRAPHLLWINLITDCFPALALGMEKPEKNIMRREARSPSEGIFSGGMGFAIAYQGLFVTLITLASYCIGRFVMIKHHGAVSESMSGELGTTMAFITLALSEICHSFNMRSLHGSIFSLETKNYWLSFAAAASLAVTTAVVEIPVFAKAFGFVRLDAAEYMTALGLALAIIPITEFFKLLYRKRIAKRH